MEKTYRFKLNGKWVEVSAPPAATLLETLRERLHLTGAKEGCARGDCGACTVIMDERPIHSCLTIMEQVEGRDVRTVEGLSRNEELDPLQRAFVELGAVQCGYCTPGILMVSKALLEMNPHPGREDVVEALRGTLCRCTGYVKIIEAVLKASKEGG